MHGNDHLATVRMSPLLMTTSLAREREPMALQKFSRFLALSEPETAGSRKSDFQNLCPFCKMHIRRLKPERERFLRIRDGFFFRVARACATRQLRKNCGPSLRLRVELDNDAQLHWGRILQSPKAA